MQNLFQLILYRFNYIFNHNFDFILKKIVISEPFELQTWDWSQMEDIFQYFLYMFINEWWTGQK